jgi:ribosomal protein L11 methyltransferase
MGARHCDAFDIDPGAVDNARSNVELNGCTRVHCAIGVADALVGRSYDVILANIERNVLLDAMPLLSAAMKPGAALLLSGFVVTDRHMLASRARECGLELAERMNEGDWALLGCRKPRNTA